MLQDTIDDLDSVISELADLRQALIVAERDAHPTEVLWEIEHALLRASARAARRADTVHRAIDLMNNARIPATAGSGTKA